MLQYNKSKRDCKNLYCFCWIGMIDILPKVYFTIFEYTICQKQLSPVHRKMLPFAIAEMNLIHFNLMWLIDLDNELGLKMIKYYFYSNVPFYIAHFLLLICRWFSSSFAFPQTLWSVSKHIFLYFYSQMPKIRSEDILRKFSRKLKLAVKISLLYTWENTCWTIFKGIPVKSHCS